jgi:tetratricopeptide (TPR) repeat protein
VALGLLAALAAAPAAADEVAEARARFDQGARLYRAGKYREAIGQFEAAYRVKPHGAIHFNIAQCREKLEEWPAALRSYHDYLREVPDATDRAAVRAAIGRIEHRLASAGVQALLVYSDPPGAEVRLDGKVVGRTPFHITLPPRSYLVTLSLDGYQAEEREAGLAPDAARVVDVVLRSAPAGRAVATPPAQPGPRTAPPPEPKVAAGTGPDLAPRPPAASLAEPPSPPPPGPRAGGGRRLYAWIAAGAAVAAGGAGAWYGLAARQKQNRLLDGQVHPDAAALARDAKHASAMANLCYGLSGVAAAGGVTLFFVEGRF